jgi:hypothetical protein
MPERRRGQKKHEHRREAYRKGIEDFSGWMARERIR